MFYKKLAIFALALSMCGAVILVAAPSRWLQVSTSVIRGALPSSPQARPIASPKIKQLLAAAQRQIGVTRSYDPAYVQLSYPNGDVSLQTGVCSDGHL